MKRKAWKKLLTVGLLGGAILLQTPACVEQAAVVTAVTSTITAGGVLYLVSRVFNN
jgi:hypothetical protein